MRSQLLLFVWQWICFCIPEERIHLDGDLRGGANDKVNCGILPVVVALGQNGAGIPHEVSGCPVASRHSRAARMSEQQQILRN